MKEKSKLLRGIDEISSFLSFSKPMTYKWIGRGMPAFFDGKTWFAHQENLESYWKIKTNVKMPKKVVSENSLSSKK